MRCAAITALLSCVAMAQPFPYTLGQPKPGDNEIRPRLMRSDGPARLSRIPPDDFAFFEAFPSNGSGTNGVCSTTAPTGAKGEALTFTRATNATCTKTASGGLATTGIANGDLVVLSSGQPRVEYDSNGVLGLLVEGARTNLVLRSEEIDNAAYGSGNSGAAAPTVTANYATAPDGTLTADRLEVPNATAGQYSYRYQAGAGAAQHTYSLYVRGNNGTSGTMHFWGGNTPNVCTRCSYNSTSWTRCTLLGIAGTTQSLGFGNDAANAVCVAAGAVAGALDVSVWGVSAEVGAYATSYIPTTSASATRNAETATFPVTSTLTDKVSLAFSQTTPAAPWTYSTRVPLLVNGVYEFAASGANVRAYLYPAASWQNDGAHGLPGSGRFAAFYDGATRGVCSSGTCTTAASASGSFTGSPWTMGIGNELGSLYSDSIISRICLDPDPTRCR